MKTSATHEGGFPTARPLSFPGGSFVQSRASKAALQDSALAWLGLASTQIGSVRYWMEQDGCTAEAIKSLEVLRNQLGHVRQALVESEHAK